MVDIFLAKFGVNPIELAYLLVVDHISIRSYQYLEFLLARSNGNVAVVHPINGDKRISIKWFDLADFFEPEAHL